MEKLKVGDAILDGEVVAIDKEGRSDFGLLQNALDAKIDKNLRYYAFDLLYLNGEDLRQRPLLERKELLRTILPRNHSQILFSDHLIGNAHEVLSAACDYRLEGIVSKLKDAPYYSGRSEIWVKTKCINREEFIIGGYTLPRGSRKGIGSLLLGVWENNKFKYVGRAGTGFSQQMLKDLKILLDKKRISKSPFEIKPPREGQWVKPELVAEISFSNWTKDGVLRTPVFLSLRHDKPSKEVIMDKSISSPDKILYVKEKITKQMIKDYYEYVSPWILPHVSDRPLSLMRCPEGTSKTCFYQKHITGEIPEGFHVITLEEEKGKGDYITIDSLNGLIELVQLNSFEIHAWNCRKDKVMNPDQIVMDLDPGDEVPWKTTIKAAFELKEVLEGLNLKSFVKLTGGKGIHLHVPLSPEYSWDEVKAFCHTLSLYLVEMNPRLYTANMSKAIRAKKIFIDYLRNGYGATAVIPYSLRAKEKSYVALPITWEELKKVKSSQEYNLGKTLMKLKRRKKDPWAGIEKLKQKIPILHKKSKAA